MAKKSNTLLGFLGLGSIVRDRSLPKNPATNADFAEILSVHNPRPKSRKVVADKYLEHRVRHARREGPALSI